MAKKKPIAKLTPGKPVPSKVFNPPAPERSLMASSVLAPSSATPPPDPNVITIQSEVSGSSGIRIYAGYFSEDYLVSELHGTDAADAFDKMRRSDAKMKMALKAVKDPIMASPWEVHPGSDDDEHKLHAQFIEHVLFKDMDRPFSKHELLSIADFGFYVLEITHKPVLGHPTFGDYIGLRSLGWRSPRSVLYWRLDPNTGKIDHIRQLITGDLQRFVDIPGQFLLVGSLEKEGDNYEGISLQRAAYGPWKRKNLYLRLMAIGNERNAVPTPTLEVPENKEVTQQYKNAVQSLQNYTSHQNAYITFPAGWKMDFLKSNFDPEKLKTAIDFENSEMVSAFMANFLLLGSTQSGSRAVSMDQSEFFLGAIQLLADEACKPFNDKLIPELIKMKFGPQEAYPQLKVSGISDKAGIDLANALKALAESQYIQPDDDLEDHLRRRYGLTKKSDKGVRLVQAPKSMQQADNVVTTDNPQKTEAQMQGSELTSQGRKHIAPSNFVFPKDKRYPIHDLAHARNALARSSGKPEEAKVRAAVYRKYPQLNPDNKKVKAAEEWIPGRLTMASVKVMKRSRAARSHIPQAREDLKALMANHLAQISAQMAKDILSAKKRLPDGRRRSATANVEPQGTQDYKSELKDALTSIALKAEANARAELPSKKNIKLVEEKTGIQLSEFKKLPADVQARITEQSNLIVDTQMADLKKAMFFQYGHSVDSTGDDAVIGKDLEEAADGYIDGQGPALAANNAASMIVNEARNAFFLDDDVTDGIQALQFVNGDPVCPLCTDLDGSTFDPDDPEAARYFPPLHHNCACILVPIPAGEKVEITGLKPSSSDLDEYMTFSEACAH